MEVLRLAPDTVPKLSVGCVSANSDERFGTDFVSMISRVLLLLPPLQQLEQFLGLVLRLLSVPALLDHNLIAAVHFPQQHW